MKKFKAVFFDLDGTLVRTMEAYFEAWKSAYADFGFSIESSDYYPLEGMEAKELAKTLCIKYGVGEQNIEKIVERKKDYFMKIFSGHHAELYPGVANVLDALVLNKIPIALVTASVKEQVMVSATEEFLKKFTVLVTGEIAGRGKPYPDPYLKGAELLGVNPEECAGVENASLGIKSVKSAGMYCFAVAHTVSEEKLKEADIILPVFEELSKFFQYK